MHSILGKSPIIYIIKNCHFIRLYRGHFQGAESFAERNVHNRTHGHSYANTLSLLRCLLLVRPVYAGLTTYNVQHVFFNGVSTIDV